jgi:hypothetical protein
MRWLLRAAAVSAVGWTLAASSSIALAQMPMPVSPEASEIAACLCLGQASQMAGADLSTKRQAYGGLQSELARLDAQLQRERAGLDVNNTQAVARFRQLLAQRDAVAQRSSGPIASQTKVATERYDRMVNEYNARCANRPRDPILLNRVQATLTCPPAY